MCVGTALSWKGLLHVEFVYSDVFRCVLMRGSADEEGNVPWLTIERQGGREMERLSLERK